MLIVCPSCATSYDVELASLGPKGRQVRCLRCRAVWQAAPSQADKLLAAAEAIGPERREAQEIDLAAAFSPEPAVEVPVEAESDIDWHIPPADEPGGDARAADEGAVASPVNDREDASTAADGEAASTAPNGSAEVEAPPIAPVDLDEGRSPIDIDADHVAEHHADAHEDIESFAARRRRRELLRRPARWPLSRLQTGILALVIVDSILVGWRSDVVRVFPQTAAFYALMGMSVNLRGLDFDGVVTTTEEHEGVPILVVEGNIVNAARKVVDVPRLKFVVRNTARQEIYAWTAVPSRTVLPPGEAVSFRSRLAAPPAEGRDVLVRFVNRRDVLTGAR